MIFFLISRHYPKQKKFVVINFANKGVNDFDENIVAMYITDNIQKINNVIIHVKI